jgi:hypothetical protein
MHPLCTLVHTSLGPTPLNHPAIPSLLYMSFKPVTTDEVSRLIHPGLGVCVEGEDVEIDRVCCFKELDLEDAAMIGAGDIAGADLGLDVV